MFKVSRPSEAVELNCCVTDTKFAPRLSKTFMILAKSRSDRVRRSTLYTTTQFTRPLPMSGARLLAKVLLVLGA